MFALTWDKQDVIWKIARNHICPTSVRSRQDFVFKGTTHIVLKSSWCYHGQIFNSIYLGTKMICKSISFKYIIWLLSTLQIVSAMPNVVSSLWAKNISNSANFFTDFHFPDKQIKPSMNPAAFETCCVSQTTVWCI